MRLFQKYAFSLKKWTKNNIFSFFMLLINVKRIIRFLMMFYWMMIASMATIPFLFFSCISCLPLRSFFEVKTTDWCFTSRCLTKDTSPTCLPSTSTNSLKYYPIIGQYYDNQNFILLLPLKNLILFVCLQPDYQISLCDDTDTDRVNEPDDAECRLCHTSCWLELAESEFSLHPSLPQDDWNHSPGISQTT